MIVLAHLGLAVALETVLPQLRDPEYGYRMVRVREQQRRHPARPLVLVMGTSRTANGFDPTAAGFPDAPGEPLLFNFGTAGGWPIYVRTRLSALRAEGVRPDAVVVELFLVALTMQASPDHLCGLIAPKLTAGDLRRLQSQVADPMALCRSWAAARLNSWQTQRMVILNHVALDMIPPPQRINHYWENTHRFGFDPYPLNRTDELRESRRKVTQRLYSGSARVPRIDGEADHAVRELIADCRAAGTPIAFFTTPESPVFRSWYTPEARAGQLGYLRRLSEEFGCPVFPAPDDFAEEDFGDGHHMLPSAAARFSRQLAAHHIRPWLAGALGGAGR
jgi:hypothetical protein